MGNNKFRDVKIGDKVWVYNVSMENLSEVIVTGIKSDNFDFKKDVYKSASYSFGTISGRYEDRVISHIGEFYIDFSEPISKRGSKFVGHYNKEDGVEFVKKISMLEIENLKEKIKKLEEI